MTASLYPLFDLNAQRLTERRRTERQVSIAVQKHDGIEPLLRSVNGTVNSPLSGTVTAANHPSPGPLPVCG
jgi:hypothetical protein